SWRGLCLPGGIGGKLDRNVRQDIGRHSGRSLLDRLPEEVHLERMENARRFPFELATSAGDTSLSRREPADHRVRRRCGRFRGRVKAAAQRPISFPVLENKRLAGPPVSAQQMARQCCKGFLLGLLIVRRKTAAPVSGWP